MDRIRKWSVWQLNLLRYLTLILVVAELVREFQSVAKDRWKSRRYDAKASGRLKYTNPKRERGTVPRNQLSPLLQEIVSA